MENLLVRLLPRRKFGVALRYGATCAIIVITAALRYSLDGPLHNFPILLFIPAVFLCALLFDRGSGFFATVLSATIAAYLFITPIFSFAIGLQDTFALLIFVAIGFTMSFVTEALREAVRGLDESEAAKALLL